ncbi:nitroreductase family protein [Subtercola sp. YIM 133946]|uniref:nitroreductase family protein n=1 Tax=Subtercola sp. YIM 133946 TaxID=3118909 RepID=UPI002F93212C
MTGTTPPANATSNGGTTPRANATSDGGTAPPTNATSSGGPNSRRDPVANTDSAASPAASPAAAVTRSLLDELVLLASRSPSPHNTQPWSPRVVSRAPHPAAEAEALGEGTDPTRDEGEGTNPTRDEGGGTSPTRDADDALCVEVAIVPSRTLPAGDPSFRDVVLSIGAWVESFSIGAAAAGFGVEVETLEPLLRLQELPVTGPADPDAPVVRLRLVEQTPNTASSAFTPDDVRRRAVYRGRLAGHPETWNNLGDVDLPPWLSLRRLDDRAMAYLSRLGIAFTGSRRSIARELLQWLRLDPAHPRYTLDGMTDVMLGIPRPLARLAAPATRYARLRDPVLAAAGMVGRASESLERARSLRPLELSLAESSPDSPTHLVLVANARLAAADDTTRITAAMDSRIGVSEPDALQAGRALQRLWLHAHARGLAVSPHSELIDSPLAHGLLRKRLSLGRSDVALSVFSAGLPQGAVPRSPRLTDPQWSP